LAAANLDASPSLALPDHDDCYIERRRVSYITDLVGLVLMKPDLRSCEEDLLVDEITGSYRLKSADAYFSSAKFA
jgi:hypothetical protein